MLVTSFLLGSFLAIGFFARRLGAWTRALIIATLIIGLLLLMWGK